MLVTYCFTWNASYLEYNGLFHVCIIRSRVCVYKTIFFNYLNSLTVFMFSCWYAPVLIILECAINQVQNKGCDIQAFQTRLSVNKLIGVFKGVLLCWHYCLIAECKAGHCGAPDSILAQSLWHWNGCLSEYLSFPLSCHFADARYKYFAYHRRGVIVMRGNVVKWTKCK